MIYPTPDLHRVGFRVSNLVFGGLTFYQMAYPDTMLIRFLPDGGREVALNLKVCAYEMLAGDERGAEIPRSFLAPPEVALLGNSNYAVDAATGKPSYRNIDGFSAMNLATNQPEQFAKGQDWEGFVATLPGQYIFQDKFLGMLSASEISIDELATEYGQGADAAPSRYLPAL